MFQSYKSQCLTDTTVHCIKGPKTDFKSPDWLIKNDKNSSAMLVPFLDIANHSSLPNCNYSLGESTDIKINDL